MKLRQLQFVQKVAETQSFSKAAEICSATQPTLSNAISQLEKELGGRLFARSTRKVELTPFGRAVMGRIEAILEAEQELLRQASAFHNPEEKLLRIGFSPLVDMRRINDSLQPYRHRYSNHGIFFKECLLDDLGSRLADDVIDLAILPRDMVPDDLDRYVFYSDPMVYLPSQQDPSRMQACSQGLTLSQLPDDPIILTGGGCGLNGTLHTLFTQQGSQFAAYPGEATSYQAIEEWSELGIGAGILPQAKLTSHRTSAVPLFLKDGELAQFSFVWVWPRHALTRPHIAAFLDYIKTTVPALMRDQGQISTIGA